MPGAGDCAGGSHCATRRPSRPGAARRTALLGVGPPA